MRTVLLFILACSVFAACSVSTKIQKSAQEILLNNPALQTAHVGISIYEPATGKWWYNYQGDKYFVPASNTKLATCYAAMKYLGDSLVGLRYEAAEDDLKIIVQPTGDPTFLHPGFVRQPVLQFFQQNIAASFMAVDENWQERGLGSGWSWNDYSEDYMAERSVFPIYGNVIHFKGTKGGLVIMPCTIQLEYGGHADDIEPVNFKSKSYSFTRQKDQNIFVWDYSKKDLGSIDIPFITSTRQSLHFLKDTVKTLKIALYKELHLARPQIIHSQPTDSLLRPMMHRSDNFFAEQSLLMVSNEHLGYMNDEKIIDTLLKTDFKDLPQKPTWVDGSGLSRYNLFTPQDLVTILNKMRKDFGMERIRRLLPTGNEGTLTNYYKADSTFIYAKTGTLSGVVALSGFLTTVKGKELIFSVQVNNHHASSVQVRRAVEKFIQHLRKDY